MATTMPIYDGQPNTNEIYSALFNLHILFQRMAQHSIHKDSIVDLITNATGMYGDTGVIQSMDITGTYDFTLDSEASKLLNINRNKSQKVEKVTIDHFRQTDVTNDAYISKRAFLDEGSFSMFNSYLISTLTKAVDAEENGRVKSALGSYVPSVASCSITIEMPAQDPDATYVEQEAISRRRAAAIKKKLLDIKADIKDNQRTYNGFGQYASYDWSSFTPVFSSNYLNEVNSEALYSAFNPEYIKLATEDHIWTSKWFGTVGTTDIASVPASNTNIYTTVERNSDGSDNFPLTATQQAAGVIRLFPGDLIPIGVTLASGANWANANEYKTRDDSVIGFVFSPDAVMYLRGYEQGDSFHNARSSTDNHYLRYGYSDVFVSQTAPFFVLKEVNPA